MTSVPENPAPSVPPLVASYIVTFLKQEMLHVYRQVTALTRWRTEVWCQKRENADRFPFERVHLLPKPWSHQLRRWWMKSIRHGPILMYRSEARTLLRQLHERGARLLHVYFGHMGVHLLPVLEISPVPVVVSFHGADAQVDLDRPRHLLAAKRLFELARFLIVRSQSLADRLIERGCPAEKIRLHRAGVPLKDIPFRPREAPSDGAWRCVQAGRLITKKGFATTLRAFATFGQKYPRATLTLAGEGELRTPLWQLAQELRIADRVNFTGFLGQEELRALYAQSHLFLHPSEVGPDGNQEGVPNSMLEAMASGLPILATRHGGIPEAVEHGASGLLVPERDDIALAAEMQTLVTNPALYASLAQAAATRVGQIFDLRATAATLEKIYDEATITEP